MSGGPEAAVPPPGWYRDQPDASGFRWWDGRAWTDHRRVEQPGRIEQPPLAAGTSTNTVWIWLLSLLPLASLAAEQPVLLSFGPVFREQLRLQRRLLANPDAVPPVPPGVGQLGGLFALSWGTSLLLIGLAVIVGFLDWRALRRRGVVQPFHWAWGFLSGVYLVGRAVVVRRRTGHGLAPLWLAIALLVVAMLVQFTEFFTLFQSAASAT